MSDVTQEFIDAMNRYGWDDVQTHNSYLSRLAPTGNENIALLQQVLIFAHLEPKKFDMANWAYAWDEEEDDEVSLESEPLSKTEPLACGTTFCLAGTAAWLTLKDNEGLTTTSIIDLKMHTVGDSIEQRGQKSLGFNEDQRATLFYFPNNLALVTAACNYIAGQNLVPEDLTVPVEPAKV